jgi:tetratricopeptide (TPR) repeat protein
VKEIRRHPAAIAALVALAVSATPTLLAAQYGRPHVRDPNVQRGGPPNADTPHMLIAAFHSPDHALGVQAANDFRQRMMDENSARDLYIVPKKDVEGTLAASGYRPDSALSATDLLELGKQLRADEAVDARVEQLGKDSLRIAPRILVRLGQSDLIQPLPVIYAKNTDDAAKDVQREVEAARKQIPGFTTCRSQLTAQKFAEAIAAAKQGVAAYPQSTFARACELQALSAAKAPPDDIIAVARESLALDSLDATAAAFAADAYSAKNDTANAIAMTLVVYKADPTNSTVANNLVNSLVQSGNPEKAIPIIDDMLQSNPYDASMLRTKWLLLLNARHYKDALAAGEAMIKADTAAATADFFTRMAATATADSNAQAASEYLARGAQKFPANADLQIAMAASLARAGQLQPALLAAQKAVAADPKVQGGWAYVVSLQSQLNQPDSALAAAHTAIATGADKAAIGNALLGVVGAAVKKAQASTARADWEQAYTYGAYADSLASTPTTKFFTGFAAFSVGSDALNNVSKLQSTDKAKACEEIKVAEDMWGTAQIDLVAGGQFQPDAVGKMMNVIQQYSSNIAPAKKALCGGK